MNARELAEKITWLTLRAAPQDVPAITKELESFLISALEEHEEELICEDCGYAGSLVKPSLLEAKAAAYEECAKIVEDHESGKNLCAEGVAERIRSLVEKTK